MMIRNWSGGKNNYWRRKELDITMEKNMVVVVDTGGTDLTSIFIGIKDEKNPKRLIMKRQDTYTNFPELSEKNRIKHDKTRSFFKRLICNHVFIPIANSHGDIINVLNNRTYIVCEKCGKGMWIPEYISAPYSYTHRGLTEKE